MVPKEIPQEVDLELVNVVVMGQFEDVDIFKTKGGPEMRAMEVQVLMSGRKIIHRLNLPSKRKI